MILNLEQYLQSLRSEKFRSTIIYHNDSSVLRKFLKDSADKMNGIHLNLLEHFINNQELSDTLDSFSVTKLKSLLEKVSKGYPIVFISDIDFLLDTWGNQEKTDFVTFISKQWNSFYPVNATTLIFGVQTDHWLLQVELFDNKGNSRIRKLNDFKAIS